MNYLRGEPQYPHDHHKIRLPESVRTTLRDLLEQGAKVIPAGERVVSASRAFSYVLGTKQPSESLHAQLVATYDA